MKNAVAFLLIIALLAQVLNKLVVVTAFELQEDYIASELCEEREVPESSCHGSCQLDKKLSESNEDGDQPISQHLKNLPNFSPFISQQDAFSFNNNQPAHEFVMRNCRLEDELFPSDIFHPPS